MLTDWITDKINKINIARAKRTAEKEHRKLEARLILSSVTTTKNERLWLRGN
jgi:hypothetical protein